MNGNKKWKTEGYKFSRHAPVDEKTIILVSLKHGGKF